MALGADRVQLYRFAILVFMNLSNGQIARVAHRANGLSIAQIGRNVTDHKDGLCDVIEEAEPPQISCLYDLEGSEQGYGNGSLMLLAATNSKVRRVKRRQRLDRLLNRYREAA